MWNRRHRWIRRLTAGLAFAVLVVPAAAQARIVEDTGIAVSKGSRLAYGESTYRQSPGVPLGEQKARDAAAYRQSPGVPLAEQNPVVRPDDRSVRFSPQGEVPTFATRPDDRSIRFTPQGEAPVVFAAPSDGFNWSDAGIGAGIGLGAALLAFAAAAMTRRHGGRGTLAGA